MVHDIVWGSFAKVLGNKPCMLQPHGWSSRFGQLWWPMRLQVTKSQIGRRWFVPDAAEFTVQDDIGANPAALAFRNLNSLRRIDSPITGFIHDVASNLMTGQEA
jgi:hypothetical protein